jgi:hypothetical protein
LRRRTTLIAAAMRPSSLRIRRNELLLLVALGIGGLALVQWSLLLRDPPGRDRHRAGDPVRRSDPGRALGSVATRAGITAMLEPVLAIAVAWAWLGESLDLTQLSGAAATLAGISLAQTSR